MRDPDSNDILYHIFDKVAFEYNGCYFHGGGCPPGYFCKVRSKLTDFNKINKVKDKEEYYEDRNIKLIKIWDCELNWKMTKFMPGLDRYGKEVLNPHYDKDLDEFIKETKLELESRKGLHCSPWESLHGGRTSKIKFAYEAKEDESLLYYDFTSLYPYVLANNVFPMGHPTIREPAIKPPSIFGFINCTVLTPRHLRFPVLPISINGKLLFPLCFTCAKNKTQDICKHSDEERSITHTWTSCELFEAINQGYKILVQMKFLIIITQVKTCSENTLERG